MSHHVVSISAGSTLAEAARTFARHFYSAFPVIDAQDRVIGLLSIEHMERAGSSHRYARLIREVADRDPALFVGPDASAAWLLEQPSFVRSGHAIVVDTGRSPIGIVSLADVQRGVRAAQEEATTRESRIAYSSSVT